MKKSIKNLTEKLSVTNNGILKAGFLSIRGGKSLSLPGPNVGTCSNGICPGSNIKECTNSIDCSQGSNSGTICTNKGVCFA